MTNTSVSGSLSSVSSAYKEHLNSFVDAWSAGSNVINSRATLEISKQPVTLGAAAATAYANQIGVPGATKPGLEAIGTVNLANQIKDFANYDKKKFPEFQAKVAKDIQALKDLDSAINSNLQNEIETGVTSGTKVGQVANRLREEIALVKELEASIPAAKLPEDVASMYASELEKYREQLETTNRDLEKKAGLNSPGAPMDGQSAALGNKHYSDARDDPGGEHQKGNKPNGGKCFGAGAPILMADGSSKRIEEIEIGDEVAAFERFGPLQAGRVTAVIRHEDSEVWELGDLVVTLEHPFLVEGGAFMPIGEVGSRRLVLANGWFQDAPTLKRRDRRQATFNFTVEPYHTYVAGGYRVHNKQSVEPIVLDLDGNGIGVTEQSTSNTFFDTVGDGYKHRTAWAGAGDGVLAIDADGDGKITERKEIVFTDWDPSAEDDMAALRSVFDTNDDGQVSINELIQAVILGLDYLS